MLFKTSPTNPNRYITQRHEEHKENFYLNKKNKLKGVWLGLVYFAALCENKKIKLIKGAVGTLCPPCLCVRT